MVINEAFQHSVFAACFCLMICAVSISMIPSTKEHLTQRKSICFILGEDKEDQEYYSLATEFFQGDSVAKTDELIKHVRSIEELLHFLNRNPKAEPWARIELVVHGNVWSGLSVNILDGGERAYPKELLKASIKNKLPLINSNVIDSNTIVNVWGCGIGTNPVMNIALAKCFTDEIGNKATLNSSKKFIVFKRQPSSGQVRLVKASYWPYFFKRGYRPSKSIIAKSLQEQFPNATVNFRDAVLHKNHSSTIQESFHIPVSWTVIYDTKEDRPTVRKQDEKINWIKSQKQLMKNIEEFGIPFDRYQWTVNKIKHTDDYGNTVPAIKAIGMSTVYCVLKEDRSV